MLQLADDILLLLPELELVLVLKLELALKVLYLCRVF